LTGFTGSTGFVPDIRGQETEISIHKETFGAKRSVKPFHPLLGPPPSRGRKIKEGCPLTAWFYWASEALTANVSAIWVYHFVFVPCPEPVEG